MQKQARYLGRMVSPSGISIAEEHVRKIKEWPIPVTKQEMESFLGFLNYHREFCKNFADITDSLYKLAASVPKSNSRIDLSEERLSAIEYLRTQLLQAPVLPYPNVDSTFILDCDASNIAIGCALSQMCNGKETPIAFGSYSLVPSQRKYCTTRKELLSVVRFTRMFRHYLLGKRFLLRTDHNSIRWLFSFSYVEGQLSRWLEELENFDMEIIHRPGKLHVNADAMSRIPDRDPFCPNYAPGIQLQELPCFQNEMICTFCKNAHEKWSHFFEDVDYIVPLSIRQIVAADNDESSRVDSFEWLPLHAPEDIMKAQREDNNLCIIITWLENDVEPTQAELTLSSQDVRHYWLMKDQLFFSNRILYHRWENALEPRILLVVPASLCDDVLHFCHDVRDAGHPGQYYTYLHVKKSFYWYGLKNACVLFVKTCARCNKNKHPKRNPSRAFRRISCWMPDG